MVSATVWVANDDGASLTAIDAGQNKVATTLTGIKGPHNVQVSPNGRTMWAVSGSDSLGRHGRHQRQSPCGKSKLNTSP